MGIQQDTREPPTTMRGIYARVQGLSDHVISPSTRQRLYTSCSTFATEQPFVASFVAIQLLLSATPLLLFASFVLTTILVSFVSALLFSLFWLGAALLVLVPILFITTSLGIAVWFWAVGSFLLARLVYGLIPVRVRGGMDVNLPNGKTVVVNEMDEGFGDFETRVKGDPMAA